MDLTPVFAATLSPNPNERIQAELQLRQLESQDGLLTSVLHLVSNDTVNPGIRQAASIYFKNRIGKAWSADTEDRHAKEQNSQFIPSNFQDRQSVRDNLLPAITIASPLLKKQLTAALGTVVQNDFPEKWPQLQDAIMAGINSSNENEIETGLLALLETFRKYRFALNDRTAPNAVCERTLPTLLALGSKLLASTPQPSAPEPVGRLLHLILKIYRISCMTELTVAHQQSIVQWGTLLLQIVNRTINPADVPEDPEDREKCEWWKAKKWAFCILNRLFVRYGSVSQLPDNMAHYKPFAQNFEQNFAPEIFKAYLRQVEGSLQPDNPQWLSPRCQKYVVDFLDECVKPKSTWALLRPQLPLLISHFLFPLLCPTDEDLSLFEDDPSEWVRGHFSLYSDDLYSKPEASILSLFDTLVACRKSSTLAPLVSFATSVISDYPHKRSAREKEGAMKIFYTLAKPIIKTKPFNTQLEPFFIQHVLPDFNSPHGFLRARACQMVETFESEDMAWSEESNVNQFFEAISRALNDPALPVRVQAAIALPELFRYSSLRALVAPSIGNLMQELLKLSNEVDLDALAETFRKLVDDFQEELVPYTEQLTASLAQTYMRILTETVENDKKDDLSSVLDEKVMTAMNIIRTMEQLCSYVSSSKDILARLEVILRPAIEYTLRHQFMDLYDDLFEIIDTLLFYQKRISPEFWSVFELIYQSSKSEGVDYLDEMLGSLDNFISYGSDVFAQNPRYLEMIVDIFETAMQSTALGATDRMTACSLGESVMLNLRGQCDSVLPIFLYRAMSNITRAKTEEEPIVTPQLYLRSLELVVNAIYSNPVFTIGWLDAHGQTTVFFEKFGRSLKKFSRVHDRKLGIIAFTSLLEQIAAGQCASLAGAASQILSMIIVLFNGLPKAISRRLQMEKEMNDDAESDSDEEVDDFDDDGAPGELDDDQDYKPVESDFDAYLAKKVAEKIAAEDAAGSDDEEDEEWADELLFESPLDNVDAYKEFTHRLYQIQAHSPPLFEQATGPLSDEMKQQLTAIGMLAESEGEAAIKNQPHLAA